MGIQLSKNIYICIQLSKKILYMCTTIFKIFACVYNYLKNIRISLQLSKKIFACVYNYLKNTCICLQQSKKYLHVNTTI